MKYIAAILLFILPGRSLPQTTYVDSLIHWVAVHPKVDSVYITNLHRISYRLSEVDIKRSYEYYARTSQLSDSLHFMYGKSLARINLGILMSNSGNFEAGNRAYFEAIDYADSCGALRLKAISLNNIGDNFYTLKDFAHCREFIREAIVINTQLKAWRGIAINYELLHRCDLEEGRYGEAGADLAEGMPFAIQSGDSYVIAQLYRGFGKLKALSKEKDSAVYYFGLSMQEAKKQNDLRNEFDVYMARAQCLQPEKSARTLHWLDSAFRIAQATTYLDGISEAARELSNTYDRLGRKDSSLAYYRIYRTAADSLSSERNKREALTKEAEWIVKGKEAENLHLKEMTRLQDKELHVKDWLLLAVGACLLLTIITFLFVNRTIAYRKRREEAAWGQKLAETQLQALRAQMNPHFIFNSLTGIENFIMRNEKRLASDYFTTFSGFLRRVLTTGLNEWVDLRQDLEALQGYIDLEKLRFDDEFLYQTQVDDLLLPEKYLVPSLLAQPYLESAIAHGYADRAGASLAILLKISLHGDAIVYVIEDNRKTHRSDTAYDPLDQSYQEARGLKITWDRIAILNRIAPGSIVLQTESLWDENGRAAGNRVTITIKTEHDGKPEGDHRR